MTQTVSQGTVNGTPQFLRANRSLAHQLPPPSETWARTDVPDIVADRIGKLQSAHVIEIAARHGADVDHNAHLYRTRPGAYQFVQEHIEPPTALDCGHSGIRNLGDGVFTCGHDTCDSRFGREQAREVLGR